MIDYINKEELGAITKLPAPVGEKLTKKRSKEASTTLDKDEKNTKKPESRHHHKDNFKQHNITHNMICLKLKIKPCFQPRQPVNLYSVHSTT